MSAISFEEIPTVLKGAKNPLILTGAKSSDFLIDQSINLSNALNAYVAATGNTIAEFRAREFDRCSKEWLVEIVDSMVRPDWKGLDGKGKPDLIIFIGYLSSLLNQFLAALRSFATCETLTLDNRYASNATYSLAPSSEKDWEVGLRGLVENL